MCSGCTSSKGSGRLEVLRLVPCIDSIASQRPRPSLSSKVERNPSIHLYHLAGLVLLVIFLFLFLFLSWVYFLISRHVKFRTISDLMRTWVD